MAQTTPRLPVFADALEVRQHQEKATEQFLAHYASCSPPSSGSAHVVASSTARNANPTSSSLPSAPIFVIYKQSVLDLTKFQTLHPGGAAVLRKHAGGEITEAFLAQTAHTADALEALHMFIVGVVAPAASGTASSAASSTSPSSNRAAGVGGGGDRLGNLLALADEGVNTMFGRLTRASQVDDGNAGGSADGSTNEGYNRMRNAMVVAGMAALTAMAVTRSSL